MTNPITPAISVIMPAFNATKHIGTALDCIVAQKIPSLEVLVIDDGSSDDTSAIAERHQLHPRVIRRENGGPGAARNTGLEFAQGAAITFLDVDDVWPPDSLALRLEVLHSRPDVQMVMGCVRFEGLDGRQIPLEPWTAPNLGAGLYRREVFQKIGVFEPSLLLDDIDWFWRARDAKIPTVRLDAITLHYRRHEESLTAAKTWIDLGLAKVIRRALERREPGRTPAPVQDLLNLAGRR